MAELSIVIPARNEMFLAKTIENILANIGGDTEIIAVMDGYWAEPRIPDNPKVTLVHYSDSIGQRAATNRAVMLSKAKYIMKCDAHCAFDKSFDVKMIEATKGHDDWTIVPLMKNLHAFDWVCENGHRRYQGPSGPCEICGKLTVRDIMWEAKKSPNSVSYCFDSTPHFQYFGDFAKRPEGQGEITETMSLQGSCWMLTRKKYWELGICDENFGSWGSQGIEVAVKTWLSGGRVMVNKKTWYAHMFRTQGGDFGFPYPIKWSDQEKAKTKARDLFFNNKWDKQVRPLSWLIEKFWPVKGWSEEDLKKLKENTFRFSGNIVSQPEIEPQASEPEENIIFKSNQKTEKLPKAIVFYTDHALDIKTAIKVRKNLQEIAFSKHIPITSVSIKPIPDFGTNITTSDLKPGRLTDLKQILTGLENCDAEIVYICKKNILYDPPYFDLTPQYSQENADFGFREDLINLYKKLISENPKNTG